jgi:DNA-binding IclR family transcriptional regulator
MPPTRKNESNEQREEAMKKEEMSQLGVQSLEIGVGLFRRLHEFGRPTSLTELSAASEMHPSKVHRYLVSLIRTGLVAQDGRGQYRLGPFAVQLANSNLGARHAIEIASKGLQELAVNINETVFLAMWGTRGPRIIKVAESQRPVSIRPTTQGDLPLWNSASSRAFAAYMNHTKVMRLLEEELERYREEGLSEREIARRRREFIDNLDEVRRGRIARTTGERHPGVNSFSVPVFDLESNVILAVTAFGLQATLPEALNGPVPKALLQYANDITEKVGGVAPNSERLMGLDR